MGEKKVTLKDEMEAIRTLSVKINNVPPKFWEEFKKDAMENFSNNYIMKIMADHLSRIKESKRLEEIEERIAKIEEVVFDTKTEEIVEKTIPTFGRG